MEDAEHPEDIPGDESDGSAESTRELSKEQAELYGEELDAEDEAWVAKQRAGKSDAHLSCPSCLISICIDCQAHASQENRWRALYVMNVCTDTKQIEPVRAQAQGKRRRGRQTPHQDSSEVFYPVFCEVCDTKVGVRDSDGVYHFLGCVASLA